jgi:paired amphipathic helix protein Sin3a
VSNPTWQAEDGFVGLIRTSDVPADEEKLSARKNDFEAALHRTEEERYEYDWHIEANLRALTILEPIAGKIAIMDPEDRATFRLKPGLNQGMAKTAYQAV